jgi:hypothetical protein
LCLVFSFSFFLIVLSAFGHLNICWTII